jgi:STE24 endopeptidase
LTFAADSGENTAAGGHTHGSGRPNETEPLLAGDQSPSELLEAKEYGQRQLMCGVADKLLDIVFLACMAFLLARPVTAWLATYTPERTLQLIGLFVITTLLHMAVSFGLSFYSGYQLEHRFGLSHLTVGGWFWRYLKVHMLTLIFGGLLFVGLYWVIWLTGGWWWMAAAALFFLVSVTAGQLVPVLIMPLFYKVERIENPELSARMSRLSAGTGLSIEGVYRFDLSADTAKGNAMLAGLGRTRRVLMGDTLLARFTADEIEVIFAHEIGHHVFRHIRKMIVVGAVYSTIGFWLVDRVMVTWARQYHPQSDYADMPVDTLPLVMLVLTLFALLLEPLQNFISRRYERQCDRYALERTGLAEAYVSAFQKLAKLNKDDPSPHPLEVFLFHSHPPISERLAMATERA